MRDFNIRSSINTPKKFDGVSAEQEFSRLNFDSKWISCGATREMVEFAEKAAEYMGEKGLTASKIRSVYGEIKRIQMKKFEEEQTAFYLLKPKVAYTVGRDKNIDGLKMFKFVFDDSFDCVTENRHYINFCNIMEAIVAYHKAYGGRDN